MNPLPLKGSEGDCDLNGYVFMLWNYFCVSSSSSLIKLLLRRTLQRSVIQIGNT